MSYAIRFEYPEGETLYAGIHKGAFGWAPTLSTALLYESEEQAITALENAYPNQTDYARIVQVQHVQGKTRER